jgi:hypothetical protein
MRLADVEGEKAELTGMTAPGDPEGQLNPNIPDIDGELKEDGTARVFGMLSINVVVTLGIWVLWSDDLSGINSGEQLGKFISISRKARYVASQCTVRRARLVALQYPSTVYGCTLCRHSVVPMPIHISVYLHRIVTQIGSKIHGELFTFVQKLT